MSGETFISYHYPCPDGIFAALAAHLGLQQTNSTPVTWLPNTVYQPRQLQDLSLKAGDTLYMLDFAGPQGFAHAAAQTGARVIVLDHHKTAIEMLTPSEAHCPNLELQLDINRSGATIALDYFKPQISQDIMTLFKYIEDADLWRWQLPDSKQFHAGLGEMKLEYDVTKNPAIFDQLCRLKAEDIIDKGTEALAKQETLIAAAVKAAFTVELGGSEGSQQDWGCCLGVMANPDLSSIRSALGNALAQASGQRGLRAIGVVAYHEEAVHDETRIKVSLRSLGQEDTTAISQRFGGGGHRNASSFMTETAIFDDWIVTT